MTAAQKVPVWTWRDAIRKSDAPPLTKLLCLTISLYVNDVGKGAWPPVKALMDDTGLSNRSIATHLQNAVDFQLLTITRETGKDGRLKRYTYHPRFPDTARLPSQYEHDGDGVQVSEVHLACPGEGGSSGPDEPDDVNHVNEVHLKRSSPSGTTQDVCESARARDDADLLEDLRDDGRQPHVVENLIAPVLGKLEFGSRDPGKLLREIRDELAPFPADVLAVAAVSLGKRTKWPSADMARKACEAAARKIPPKPLLRITPNSPSWAAWQAHRRAHGKANWASYAAQQGYDLVDSEWPSQRGPPAVSRDVKMAAAGDVP